MRLKIFDILQECSGVVLINELPQAEIREAYEELLELQMLLIETENSNEEETEGNEHQGVCADDDCRSLANLSITKLIEEYKENGLNKFIQRRRRRND